MSPRAWGWSVGLSIRVRMGSDVPTRVGLVRPGSRSMSRQHRCPHARGAGPYMILALCLCAMMSPRAWGWSGLHVDHQRQGHDVPTRVGLVRTGTRSIRACRGCPHARGAGPHGIVSPPTWNADVPTRVGLVRGALRGRRWRVGCPHARGAGPESTRRCHTESMMSPRAWGWSGVHRLPQRPWPDVPTRVGLVRHHADRLHLRRRCPHARGAGPQSKALITSNVAMSPRAWGWSSPPTRTDPSLLL